MLRKIEIMAGDIQINLSKCVVVNLLRSSARNGLSTLPMNKISMAKRMATRVVTKAIDRKICQHSSATLATLIRKGLLL